MRVLKRDGRVKEFNVERIKTAIQKCYVEVLGESEGLSCFKSNEVFIIPSIEIEIERLNKEQVSIEEIQDIIVGVLNKLCIKAIPVAYQRYRDERKIYRESKHSLTKSIAGLIDYSNIEVMTENSNKQSHLASTQRDLIAGEVSKYMTRTQLIPSYIIEAEDKGIIKIHDKDYYLQSIFNCDLVNLKDMLDNGTVINKKLIESPKSLRTAMTVATQISAQIASFTFGGQTMSLSHLAPYVRKSKFKIERKLKDELQGIAVSEDQFNKIVDMRLKEEIKDGVQTFNYQLSTLNSTNGQSPFLSLAMYISEDKEYEKETVMLIEEFLKQRIDGIKNEYGVVATQTFPKLLYFLDENNTSENSEYYYLTKLAAISVAKRMSPDFISVKKMKDIHKINMAWPCINN
ncbi:MAG: anaerobic ribonucleoside-triphosphate reductase [Sarcina sp.]